MRRYGKRFGLAVLFLLLAGLGRVGWLFVVAFQQQQRNQRLVLAVEHNDTRAVLSLLQQGADPNLRDVKVPPFSIRQYLQLLFDRMRGSRQPAPSTQGSSLLAVAFAHKNLPVVQALLSRGARDVDAWIIGEKHLSIPLVRFAAEWKHPELVWTLLKHGAALHSKQDRNTLLQSCAENGYIGLAAYLLARDTDVNGGGDLTHYDGGDTPLLLAIAGRHKELVRLLLAYGADANGAGYIETPLMIAAGQGDDDLVRLLLAHNAEKDAENRAGTAVTYAADNDHWKIVKTLVEAGADVKGDAGGEALESAASCGNVQIVKYLLNKGAEIDWEKFYWGETPLMVAKNTEMVKLLLDLGADIDYMSRYGTPLSKAVEEAAETGDLSRVKLLLALGADPNIVIQFPAGDERTALSIARNAGSSTIVALLKKAGAKR